jgi:hypothetical protein
VTVSNYSSARLGLPTLELQLDILFAKDAPYVTIIVENVTRYCHKADAFGMFISEIPTLGLGKWTLSAGSATIWCNAGTSFSATRFTFIVQAISGGPTGYWIAKKTKAKIK